MKPRLDTVAECAMVFGSAARKEETEDSNLDVCVVVKSNLGKKRAQEVLHALAPEARGRYGARLAPLCFTAPEFRRLYRLKKPPVPQIVDEGQVITGSPIRRLLRG